MQPMQPFKSSRPSPRPRADPIVPSAHADGVGPAPCDRGSTPANPRPLPPTRLLRPLDDAFPHDALLALDIETVVDPDLCPADWDAATRFPKPAWHRVVAISVVEASLRRDDRDGSEIYAIRSCRSGGEPGWSEERLLRTFWRMFEGGRYRVVTWNGRGFDVPTLLLRSMRHGIATPAWFRRGTRFAGYGHRYAVDWHTDLMEAMADFGASARLTLDEGAALIGAPGKLGESGAEVPSLVAAGEIRRVRDYCETDVLNLLIVYVRWAHLTGRTGAAAHDAAVEGLIGYLEAERGTRPHLGRFIDEWRRRSGPGLLVASRSDRPVGPK